MLFSSVSFLYSFLPAVLLLYFALPSGQKNLVLFLASLLFYFYGEPVYCILLIGSILSGYLHGLWIGKAMGSQYARLPLVSSIVVVLGLLFFFKYINFFIANFNYFAPSEATLLRIILPLGISFYSFQILSYTIDVYRGKTRIQRNFLAFATYVSMFPQLIAGPIVRYKTVEKELSCRTHSFANLAWGINRFIAGLSKKILLANTLGQFGELLSKTDPQTVLSLWLIAFAFMMQIYFDFSGYSDMAIGLGRIFGFHFPENFNYPYISRSITEFWQRWHISLGTWFRDYLYIPLGGNRVPSLTWGRNIIIVWLLVGFWHGAEWNFIIWGLIFAALLIAEKQFIRNLLGKVPSVLAHLYVLLVVLLSFVFFNADGISQSIENIRGMFGFLSVPLTSAGVKYYFKSYAFILIIAAIGATPLPAAVAAKVKEHATGKKIINIFEPAAHVILLVLVTGYLIDGSFNPFLYFRF